MSFLTQRANITVNASAVALAWVNAFHAASQDPQRPILFRTLSVEIFDTGVQFIATSGSILFRTWVPLNDKDNRAYEWPESHVRPTSAVVVMDAQHFALNFIKALAGAAKQFEVAELSMTVEPAPEPDGDNAPPLGDTFSQDVLTLRAFGQQMHCQLLEDVYPNWRNLKFGIDDAERIEGMTVSTSMLATIGKLKGVRSVDMTFTGDNKRIDLVGAFDGFRGLLMPMERKEKERVVVEREDEQTDALEGDTNLHVKQSDGVDGAKVKLNGRWVPATEANVAAAARPVIESAMRTARRSGRDRAAGRDE